MPETRLDIPEFLYLECMESTMTVQEAVELAYRRGHEAAIEALSAAGRLLPEGGETREEWTATMRANATDRRQPSRATRRFTSPSDAAAWALGFADGGQLLLWRRDRREWQDGTALTGPWVAVDQETTDG